jgi:Putative Ig domain
VGCGANRPLSQDVSATPSITQVFPQNIAAGSASTTLKVTGTNFPTKSAILWNGAAVATTAVDANTLSGTIQSNSLASPATVQLQVQNLQTMQQSAAVPVVISNVPVSNTSTLSISTVALPQSIASASYTVSLAAGGGTAPYTWSITSGSLPAGLNLVANTGVISGTALANGTYSLGITATDSSSPAKSATTTLTLSVASALASSTLTNLQNSPGWNSSGQLAPTYADCAPLCSGVTWSMTQGVTAPSLSGIAAQFNLGGTTPYSNVLFYNQLIGTASTQGLPDNNRTLVPSLHNFTYDVYFYLSDTTDTQAVEFDINWFMNSIGITWGTECRIRGGNGWDIWDNVNAKWVDTGVVCKPLVNAWNHVTVSVQRGPNNSLIYQSITLNGVTSNINQTYAPFSVPSDWYGITVNYQMDGDENQTAISTYLDKLSFTYQ